MAQTQSKDMILALCNSWAASYADESIQLRGEAGQRNGQMLANYLVQNSLDFSIENLTRAATALGSALERRQPQIVERVVEKPVEKIVVKTAAQVFEEQAARIREKEREAAEAFEREKAANILKNEREKIDKPNLKQIEQVAASITVQNAKSGLIDHEQTATLRAGLLGIKVKRADGSLDTTEMLRLVKIAAAKIRENPYGRR